MKKILVVCSAGGHLAQGMKLARDLDTAQLFLATESRAKNFYDYSKFEKSFFFRDCTDGYSFNFIRNFILNLPILCICLLRVRPDIVVSTGAAIGVPALFFSRLIGARTIFVESFAKVKTPTLSGRIAYQFVHEFYVQWPSLLTIYPKAEFKGPIY